ncbi:MAG: hypothetical protein WC602_03225 [archaeon]
MPKPMSRLRPLTRRDALKNSGNVGIPESGFGIKKYPRTGKGIQLSKNVENIAIAKARRIRRKNLLESMKKSRN